MAQDIHYFVRWYSDLVSWKASEEASQNNLVDEIN
jgi:hypothetical protein